MGTGAGSGEVVAKTINEWIEKKKQEDSSFRVINISHSTCDGNTIFDVLILYESTYNTP
jgi:hypothetical protein